MESDADIWELYGNYDKCPDFEPVLVELLNERRFIKEAAKEYIEWADEGCSHIETMLFSDILMEGTNSKYYKPEGI